ncbi:MAG: hypothetical protein ACPGVB_01870, partial [Chitinophagales bacterium]
SVVTYQDVPTPVLPLTEGGDDSEETDGDSVEEGDDTVDDDNPRGRGRGRRGKTAQIETGILSLNIAPNPFADFTTVHFVTNVDENASVDVYGMNGQHVANLFEGQTT